MEMKNIVIIAIICFFFILGCVTSSPTIKIDPTNLKKTMNEAYSKVTIDDGIDKDEANTLASTYFLMYISGCGGVTEIIDQNNKWEVKTVFGYAAIPFDSIFIEKATGEITCVKGPIIEPPQK